jgi:exodeoxyribonuclease VII small subunit
MDKPKMTYEEAMAKLEQIVAQIEEGKVPLEESIEKYSQATELVRFCRTKLDSAEKKIQLLTRREGDNLAPAGELEDKDAQSKEA